MWRLWSTKPGQRRGHTKKNKNKNKIKANKALYALLSPSVKVARRHGDDNGDPVASVPLFGSADVAVHREVKTEILPLARL